MRTIVAVTLLAIASAPAWAQGGSAPAGVAVKIYARAAGSQTNAYVSLTGTFLPSSPTANDGYAGATGYADWSNNYTATAILGSSGFVRVEPGKSYTLAVSSWGVSTIETNVIAPPGYRVLLDQMVRTRQTLTGSGNIVFQLQSLGVNHPGLAGMATSVSGTEVEWRVSLGSLRNGGSAGDLALIDTGAGASWGALYTPGPLYYEPVSDEISVHRPSNILRQILANQVALDIVTLSSTAYEIRCYHPTQVQGSAFPRTFTGQPYLTYRIEQGATATSLKFTKEVRNVLDATSTNVAVSRREIMTLTRTGSWPTHTFTRSDWSLEGSAPLVETRVVSSGTTAARTETIAVRTPGGASALNLTRSYTTPLVNNVSVIGEVLAGETLGTGTGLAASFDYYTDTTKFGSFGYVKSATLPGGNWVAYAYYDADAMAGIRGGRVKYTYKPYLNAPATVTQNAGQGEVTYFEYVNDVFGAPTRPSLVQTTVNGTMTGKSTTAFNDSYGEANGFPLTQSTTADYPVATETQKLQTIVRHYRDDAPDAFIRGQTYSITGPDNVKQAFGYQRGTWSGTAFTPGSGAIGTGTASRITVVQGSASSTAGAVCPNEGNYVFDLIYLVDGKSHKEVTIRNSRALVARTESYIWKNSTWQRVSHTDYTYDFAGRLTSRIASNGATYRAYYTGDLKASQTDEAGVQTTYVYDAARRVAVATRAGLGPIAAVATRYTYDAMGRVLQEAVGGGAEQIVTHCEYDDAGRIVSETPPGLESILHTYDVANRSHTVTRPDGGEITETSYRDGRPASKTGVSTVATYHTYGLETDGRRWTRVDSGRITSPRWAKSWTDWLGRGLRSETPGFAGQSTMVSENIYETGTGRLIKTTKSGYAPTLYQYNALGQVSRSGLDVNHSGVLDLATIDRISETDTYLESYNSAWWMRTDTRTYPKAGVATPTVMATSRTRLTGHPAKRVAETQSIDAEGNVTTQFVDLDRGARTGTTTTARTGFPTTQVETTLNGLATSATGFDGLTTTTTYDALLRPSTLIDSRGNITTTGYVPGTRRVSSVTDPAGNVSVTGYDTQGRVTWQRDALDHYTRFAYNERDQVTQQWGDGTMPVSYAYDPRYGERVGMSTYRGGSGFDLNEWPASPGEPDTTTWTFDETSGLLWKKTDAPTDDHPDGTTVTQTYNVRGQTATRTLARGVTTTYAFDNATGELLSQTYSDGTPTVSYTYGRSGQVETVSDVTGLRDFVYDPSKPWRLAAEVQSPFYENRVMTRLYDETVIKGRVRGFQLGPTTGSGAELEQTYGFTSVGRFETVSTLSPQLSALNAARTFRYTYRDDAMLIQSLSIDGGAYTVTRGYEDDRNLVTSLTSMWSTDTRSRYDYVYDERGQRTSRVQSGDAFADYGEATFRHYQYDGKGQVITDAGFLGGTVTDQSKPLPGRRHEFTYDNAGNRKTSNRSGVPGLADTYETNALNQYTERTNNTLPVSGTAAPDVEGGGAGGTAVAVKGRTEPAGRQGRYWADEITVGNLLQGWRGPVTIFTATRGTGGAADSYRIDSRMAEIAAMTQEFSYDDDGNLQSDGLVDYQWDAENRLVRMETTAAARGWGFPHKLIQFRYDYLGRRVQKTVAEIVEGQTRELYTRRFLYDGWNLVTEYTLNAQSSTLNLLRSYTWGLDIVSTLADAGGVGALLQIADHPNGKTYLPTYDGNGNIVSLVNGATGAVAAIYEYGPFGEPLRAETRDTVVTDQPFRFSTKYTDAETGLVYYGHRYYSTSLGRFINRDPIEESGGINLYAFCGNNGVNRWDLLGMNPQTEAAARQIMGETWWSFIQAMQRSSYRAPDTFGQMWGDDSGLQQTLFFQGIADNAARAATQSPSPFGNVDVRFRNPDGTWNENTGIPQAVNNWANTNLSTGVEFGDGSPAGSFSNPLNGWVKTSTGSVNIKSGDVLSDESAATTKGEAAVNATNSQGGSPTAVDPNSTAGLVVNMGGPGIGALLGAVTGIANASSEVSRVTTAIQSGTGQGAAAFVDGALPVFDPLASIGVYDRNDPSLQASQLIGGITRDTLAVLSGGAVARIAAGQGIPMTIGQRMLIGEFGPSWITLMTPGPLTNTALMIDYTGKWIGRVDTLLQINQLLNPPPPPPPPPPNPTPPKRG